MEGEETFTVSLLRVIGGARLGAVTSVTASIPANDSPLGRFGFQEQEVSPDIITLPKNPYIFLPQKQSYQFHNVTHFITLCQSYCDIRLKA